MPLGLSVSRRVRVLERSLFGGSGIVAAIGQTGVVLRRTRISYSVDAFMLSLTLSESRVTFRFTWCTTVIDNGPAIVNRASVVDRRLVGDTRVVSRVTLVRNRTTVRYRRVIVGAVVSGPVITGNCPGTCSGTCACGSSRTGTCGCTG